MQSTSSTNIQLYVNPRTFQVHESRDHSCQREETILGSGKIVFGSLLSADVDPKLGGKHASNSSSGDELAVSTTSSPAKMATEQMTAMGSADLLMDDKWLSSILGEEDGDKKGVKRKRPNTKHSILITNHSIPSHEEGIKHKRQRKEKKIFDPSAIEEVSQTKRRKRRKDNDALLLHQSPYLIRPCFVNVERIHVTDDIPAGEVKREAATAWGGVDIERNKLFALSKEEREVLETVSTIKKEDSTLLPCPKCHRMFFSLNNLKLHVDSGHENFTVKVSWKPTSSQSSVDAIATQ